MTLSNTIDMVAAAEFQPWVAGLETPMTHANLKAAMMKRLPTMALAYATMFKTKADLVALAQEEPAALMSFSEGATSTADWLRMIADMVDGAGARTKCGLSAAQVAA